MDSLENPIFRQTLVGGLEHFSFSPIVGMMIQSDFHNLSSVSGGRYTTNQQKWTDLEPGPWFFRPRKGAPRALGGARKKPPVGTAGVENQGR